MPTPPGVSATPGDFDAAFDDFAKGRFLIGEAEQVKDEILHYAETARTDHILLRVQWPGSPSEEALGNIERIGRIIAVLSWRSPHEGKLRTGGERGASRRHCIKAPQDSVGIAPLPLIRSPSRCEYASRRSRRSCPGAWR